MNKEVRKAKKLLESKGYKVTKYDISFDDIIDESDIISLDEAYDRYGNDFSWEQTLEEDLYEDLQGDQRKEYKVGDILMPMKLYSPGSRMDVEPHRVVIIRSKETDKEGVIRYEGFLLSSKVQKSNKYNSHYPNNIYIEDYSSILYRGTPQHKEAFIRVDDIVRFTSKDLDTRGSWKGSVKYPFLTFLKNCYQNYKSGKSNVNKYWLVRK